MRNVGSSELKNIKLAGQRKSYRLSHSHNLKNEGNLFLSINKMHFCQMHKVCLYIEVISVSNELSIKATKMLHYKGVQMLNTLNLLC